MTTHYDKHVRKRERILSILRELRPELQRRFKVKSLALFGSVVREESDEESDVDLLVGFGDTPTLFGLARLATFLEDKLQHKVDIVPEDSLRPELRESVLQELVTI